MRWIETYGGNFICMEMRSLPTWQGINASSTDGLGTDYERACNFNTMAQVIPLRQGDALVVESGSMQTSIWHDSACVPHIVSVEYSEPYVEENEHLKTMPANFFADADVCRFSIPYGQLVLFDSADDGQIKNLHTFMTFDVMPGQYDVLSKIFKTEMQSCFYIHKFVMR